MSAHNQRTHAAVSRATTCAADKNDEEQERMEKEIHFKLFKRMVPGAAISTTLVARQSVSQSAGTKNTHMRLLSHGTTVRPAPTQSMTTGIPVAPSCTTS